MALRDRNARIAELAKRAAKWRRENPKASQAEFRGKIREWLAEIDPDKMLSWVKMIAQIMAMFAV
jgi:hypothetical protein